MRIPLFGVMCLCTGAAQAQELEYRLTPYAWIPGFDTEAVFAGEETSNSGSFLDYLDGAFMIDGEARGGVFSVIGEYNWLNLSDGIDTPGPFIEGDLRLSGYMISLGLGRVVHQSEATRLEAIAGLRHWDMTAEVELARLAVEPSVTKRFTDPFIGLRGDHALTDRWAVSSLASVGGFGVGSDLQIDVQARTSYAFSERFHGVLGYRYLDVDLGDDDPIRTMTIFGPFVALDIRF